MIKTAIQHLQHRPGVQSRHLESDVMSASVAKTEGRALRRLTVAAAPLSPVVMVVDRDAALRVSLEAVLTRAGWRAETFGCAADFLARPAPASPGCLVLDVTAPNEKNLDLQKAIAMWRKDIPIVLVADRPDIHTTVQAMKIGAFDFFMKPLIESMLLSSVERALEKSETMQRGEAQLREFRERHDALTRRERDVMVLVISGLLNKQVASELGISEITVKAHRGNVMRKMQAGSLANLVTIAGKIGVAPVDGMMRNRAPFVQFA